MPQRHTIILLCRRGTLDYTPPLHPCQKEAQFPPEENPEKPKNLSLRPLLEGSPPDRIWFREECPQAQQRPLVRRHWEKRTEHAVEGLVPLFAKGWLWTWRWTVRRRRRGERFLPPPGESA